MKRFGVLIKEDFEMESIEIQDQILVLNGLFEKNVTVSITDISEARYGNGIKAPLVPLIEPTKSLVYDFYDFLVLRYKEYIDEHFVDFFIQFNKEVYGKSKKGQKKRALHYFNEIFKEFSIDGFNTFKRDVSVTGFESIEAENRMFFLYKQREAMKWNIAKRDFLLEYLYGNLNYFDGVLMNENELLNEFIAFEFHLKQLIGLNDKYKFELDFYFSKRGVLNDLFQHYNHIFSNIDIFIKVNNTIEELNSLIPAHIDSLYPVLVQLKLITDSKKDFMDYLLKEHKIKKTNIPVIDEAIQLEHAKRMQFYMNEFKELASEK